MRIQFSDSFLSFSVCLFVFVCFENFWQLSWRFAGGVRAANLSQARPYLFLVPAKPARFQGFGQKSKVNFLSGICSFLPVFLLFFPPFAKLRRLCRELCVDCAQLSRCCCCVLAVYKQFPAKSFQQSFCPTPRTLGLRKIS